MYDLAAGQCYSLRGLPESPEMPSDSRSGITCVTFFDNAIVSASATGTTKQLANHLAGELEKWTWVDDGDTVADSTRSEVSI